MRKILVLALLSFVPLSMEGARLTLRDGTVVNGNFISGTERNIIFQDNNGVRRRFDTNEIRNIDFDSFNTPAGNLPARGAVDDRRYGNRDRELTDNRQFGGDRYGHTLATGTQISVRTNEAIQADNATEGRTYSAVIEQDVMDSAGNLAIPRGSDAQLVVRRVNQGGTLSAGSLALDLESVRVGGQTYRVSTTDIEKGSDRNLGANKRTAEMVGGGAVLGTLLGAIAGGGKGAAIGAAAGAAVGAGAQVLTKGDKVRVPAETILTFRLDQPLELRAIR
jgi:hypothetical protein